MTVMVRSALRARFSLLLCAAEAAPATLPALRTKHFQGQETPQGRPNRNIPKRTEAPTGPEDT